MKEEPHTPRREDWLQDIHDRLADFETEAPDGLWEQISHRLETSADTDNVADTTHRIIPLWVRRTAAAAAAVIVLASGALLLRHDAPVQRLHEHLPATHNTIASTTPRSEQPNDDNTASTRQGRIQATAATVTHTDVGTTAKNVLAANTTPAISAENSTSHIDRTTDSVTTPSAEDNAEHRAGNDISPNRKDSEPQQTRPAKQNRSDVKRRQTTSARAMRIGAYASGGAAAYAMHSRSNGIISTVMASNDTHWEDSPLLGMLLYNRGKDTETHLRHHQPIRAGISFTYMINDRLGIESGLTYTLLASDTRDGSDMHYYEGRQRLHYLGIPLNVKYEFLRWRRFGLYGSAGVLAEQCISGRMRKEYVLDGSSYRTTTESIPTHPFQLSANISAGLRYDFTPTVGIYAEPGLSYYFDDGTSLQSVYKQRPLNFNLNVGVRFTVGK